MHHLIFEGADLAGKSWIMSRIYDQLEPKYSSGEGRLDGCHWFNCDNGVFGGPAVQAVFNGYLEIFQALEEKNLLVEKFHLTDQVYRAMNGSAAPAAQDIENKLNQLGFKIILILLPENLEAVQARLADRLHLYPHYARIQNEPDWYLRQQSEYRRAAARSRLPVLEVPTAKLPDEQPVEKILSWIKEQ